MKFEILKDFKGSPDGYTIITYSKGDEVELDAGLAEVALAEKWARVSKTAEKAAKEKARADAEKLAAEEQLKTDREAAIQLLRNEIAQLEEEGKAALVTDPSGETAKPIQELWQQKQNELTTLLA